MISFTNVIKKYGSEIVLNIDELNIKPNEIVGIVGDLGAGKTTMLSALVDLISLNGGIIENRGIPVHYSHEWKDYTNVYLDDKFLIGYLTPMEYYESVGKSKNLTIEEVHGFLNSFPEFMDKNIVDNKQYIRSLSDVAKQKIGTLATLIGNPQVVLLDEPFHNMETDSQCRLRDIIANYSATHNTTFLITSDDVNQVSEFCTRIIVLENGKIIDDVLTSSRTRNRPETFCAV